MRKALIMTAAAVVLTIGSAQAETKTWLGGLYAGTGGGEYTALNNWFSPAVGSYATNLPDASDDVHIEGTSAYGSAPSMPVVDSNVGTVNNLFLGVGSSAAGNSSLTILDGGNLVSALTGPGWQAGTTGVVSMAGGYHETSALYVGYSGAGIIKLSGDSVLNVPVEGAFTFGPFDGSGVIHLSGGAKLMLAGDLTVETGSGGATNLTDGGLVDAYDSTVVATFNGTETEFTSASGKEMPYIFFDSFDTADTDDINADLYGRQASNGMFVSSYCDNPPTAEIVGEYSVVSNKLHQHTQYAWANLATDLSSFILGEDFEFSFKVANKETDMSWTSIYLHDETGTPWDDSNFGLYIQGAASDWAFIFFRGIGARVAEEVSVAEVEALTGVPYDTADEHTFQLISHAGTGETNTYDIVVDGTVIRSGIAYRFDGTERRIATVGSMETTSGLGAFYDDIYVRLYFSFYEQWAEDWNLSGGDALRTADLEPDGMNNLLEYAFGGNPTNSDAATYQPVSEFPDVDTWEYVYRRRNDADDRGLIYDLLYNADLVAEPSWLPTDPVWESVGAIDSEFDAVTNTIPIGTYGLNKAFLKLKITEN